MVFTIPKPYVGAHLGIYDPSPDNGLPWAQETTPPAMFEKIRFDAVDVLHVGHFIVTPDGHFSIGAVNGISLAKRFEYIVKTARWMNPDIKIIAEQMYSGGEGFDVLEKDHKNTAAMVNLHTDSIRDFLQAWQAKPNITYKGKTISLRIDGYDVDHEGSTVRACTKDVLTQVRAKVDELTKHDPQHRPFIVGITPYKAFGAYLDSSMASSCDFVNMQRYSGGSGTLPESYLAKGAIEGLNPAKLTYGIEIETPNNNAQANETIDLIAKAPWTEVHGKKVAGIWTWRLGSNWEFENLMQVWLYNLVHGTKKEVGGKVPDSDQVKKEWKKEWEKNEGA
ncbi:hypothetical protein PV04_01469 [Phialophora macrospora]|uniref:Chitinase n=1 Tax=Phialophora macrospora TaxID=1851006 RepID=A0A0D2GLR4_9EURO|nr:hypothetical protein PV04_01469 [Phialophora macrospora]